MIAGTVPLSRFDEIALSECLSPREQLCSTSRPAMKQGRSRVVGVAMGCIRDMSTRGLGGISIKSNDHEAIM